MELDLQSLFGLLCTAVLIGRDPESPTLRPHLGSYTRALLVSQGPRQTTSLCNPLGTGTIFSSEISESKAGYQTEIIEIRHVN